MGASRVLDLEPFTELNGTSVKGKRVPWQKRVDLIFRQFPTTEALIEGKVPNWKRAFDKDIDLFAWILRDVLKADSATPGRSGPKPTVDRFQGAVRLRQLMGDDYSVEPFNVAFRSLAHARSLSNIAHKTGLSRTQVNRLLKGDSQPSGAEMEAIAKAFNVAPGFFAEYRLGVVVNALVDKLQKVPEATVKYWREITESELGHGG
jgi:transcriptional regulator with XRE-family HTH domain